MVVKTRKGDEVMKLTVDEVFRFRDNIGGQVNLNGAVNAFLNIGSDREVADTVDSGARLSQCE